MYKNIGKKIQLLAMALAILSVAVFLGFGAACLAAALQEGVDETLKTAGVQGAVICFVIAALSPFLSFVLYGFGSLVAAAQKQAEDSREIKEMLRHALSEGCLSDEIARKVGQSQAKALQQLATQLQLAQTPTNAPIQRPVVEEPAAQAPVQEPVQDAEAQSTVQDTAPTEKPHTPKASPAQPIRKAKPVASAKPLQPIGDSEETF